MYGRAHAAVVPLRAGAGSRLKVVEALARGVPLVSTTLGVEGYDLHDGEHALIADDPLGLAERFALLDASLRGDRRLAGSLVAAGYAFARELLAADRRAPGRDLLGLGRGSRHQPLVDQRSFSRAGWHPRPPPTTPDGERRRGRR